MNDNDRPSDKATDKAFQDYYPDNVSHYYGCGCLNPVVAVQMPKTFLAS